MKNSFNDLKKLGRKPIGTWTDGHSNTVIEVFGYTGFDFVIIDNEHGCGNNPSFIDFIRSAEAADIVPIFRVPSPHNEDSIKKVLDSGGAGVLVPNVKMKEDVEAAVMYSKFAPLGNRGACPYVRANQYILKHGTSDYYGKENDDVTLMVLIENVDAIENFDEIINVPGLDAIVFGRVDLSVSMGIPGQIDHPTMTESISKMITKANDKGMYAGMVGFGDAEAIEWSKNPDIDFVTNGTDIGTLIKSSRDFISAVRD